MLLGLRIAKEVLVTMEPVEIDFDKVKPLEAPNLSSREVVDPSNEFFEFFQEASDMGGRPPRPIPLPGPKPATGCERMVGEVEEEEEELATAAPIPPPPPPPGLAGDKVRLFVVAPEGEAGGGFAGSTNNPNNEFALLDTMFDGGAAILPADEECSVFLLKLSRSSTTYGCRCTCNMHNKYK
jgi:hypothetical protein